jgi:hypothetical protein
MVVDRIGKSSKTRLSNQPGEFFLLMQVLTPAPFPFRNMYPQLHYLVAPSTGRFLASLEPVHGQRARIGFPSHRLHIGTSDRAHYYASY